MKTTTVKRTEVIEALLVEPLAPGYWIRTDELNSSSDARKAKKTKCTVCAVGAVLRHKFDLNVDQLLRLAECVADASVHAITACATAEGIQKMLDKGQYLAALSARFETMLAGDKPAKSVHRVKLAKWVLKHFPEEFTINV